MGVQQGAFYKMHTSAEIFSNELIVRPGPIIYTIFSKTPKQVI